MEINIEHTTVLTDILGAIEKKTRNIILEGSSRSSKTWSIFQALFLYALKNSRKRIAVLRDTAVDCRDIVESDWERWLSDPCARQKQFEDGLITLDELDEYLKVEDLSRFFKRDRTKHIWNLPNGSNITFDGLDKLSKAMGKTQDVVWLNEPYLFSEKVYKQLAQRTSDFIITDWNPMQDDFIERIKKLKNSITLHSTFLNNPFCPEESRNQLLSYQMINQSYAVENKILTEDEALRYDFDLNEKRLTTDQIEELKRTIYNQSKSTHIDDDRWHWQVFGLGTKAERPNRIFHWKPISLQDYYNLDTHIYYGVDWGENHPFGIVEVKYIDGNLYLHELNYSSESELRRNLVGVTEEQLNDRGGIVVNLFEQKGIKKNRPIICDNNQPLKIKALQDYGWLYAIAAKKPPGSRLENRSLLRKLNVFYTSCSDNLAREQELHSWATDSKGNRTNEPEDLNDHLIDPTGYVIRALSEEGIIKVV